TPAPATPPRSPAAPRPKLCTTSVASRHPDSNHADLRPACIRHLVIPEPLTFSFVFIRVHLWLIYVTPAANCPAPNAHAAAVPSIAASPPPSLPTVHPSSPHSSIWH